MVYKCIYIYIQITITFLYAGEYSYETRIHSRIHVIYVNVAATRPLNAFYTPVKPDGEGVKGYPVILIVSVSGRR